MNHLGSDKPSGLVSRAFHDAALKTVHEQGKRDAVAGIVRFLRDPDVHDEMPSPDDLADAIDAGAWKESDDER